MPWKNKSGKRKLFATPSIHCVFICLAAPGVVVRILQGIANSGDSSTSKLAAQARAPARDPYIAPRLSRRKSKVKTTIIRQDEVTPNEPLGASARRLFDFRAPREKTIGNNMARGVASR